MVIHDLDIFRSARCPDKTNAILVIDPDAVLSSTIAFERFESIARWNQEIIQSSSPVQHGKFSHGYGLQTDETPDPLARK
jgi:hypothetical protein